LKELTGNDTINFNYAIAAPVIYNVGCKVSSRGFLLGTNLTLDMSIPQVGEFRGQNSEIATPGVPAFLPPTPIFPNNYLQMEFSNWTVNSLYLSIQQTGALSSTVSHFGKYNLTTEELQSVNLTPNITEYYPNNTLMQVFYAANPMSQTNISSSGIVIGIGAEIIFQAITPTIVDAFSFNATVYVGAKLTVVGSSLVANLTHLNTTVSPVNSHVGEVDATTLEDVLSALESYIASKTPSISVPLHTINKLELVGPSINYQQDYIVLSSNFTAAT